MTQRPRPAIDEGLGCSRTRPALARDATELWTRVARGAALAPSSHNTQPWRFAVVEEHLELYTDTTRRLDVVDPDGRELMISCGAALGYIRVIAGAAGASIAVETLPDADRPDLVARVAVLGMGSPRARDVARAAAIPFRRTNRGRFGTKPLPACVLDAELFTAARTAEVSAQLLTGDARAELVRLITEANRRQLRDAAFRRELARWLRPRVAASGDGLPGSALQLGRLSSRVLPHLLPRLDLGWTIARRDAALARDAPVVAIIATDRDTPDRWLASGVQFALALLDLRRFGIWASYFNQPLQIPALRREVQSALMSDVHPQLIVRLGYGRTPAATPRRPLHENLSIISR